MKTRLTTAEKKIATLVEWIHRGSITALIESWELSTARERAMQNGKLDVVVVGASLAGCAAAINIARRGARVFLVERESEADAFKSLCTHSIHSSATPAIERLGLPSIRLLSTLISPWYDAEAPPFVWREPRQRRWNFGTHP